MATASGWHYRSELVNALTHLMSTWSSADFISAVARDGGVELDQPAIIVMTHIAMKGPQRPSALAEALVTGASNASKIIGRLERDRLVTREADPRDARASLVRLTSEGDEVAAALARAGDTLADTLLTGWSVADRAELARLLTAFDRASTDYAIRQMQSPDASKSRTPSEDTHEESEES